MNEPDTEFFEAELRRLRPAPLPAELKARLERARPESSGRTFPEPRAAGGLAAWWGWLRWLAPVAAASLVLWLLVGRPGRQPGHPSQPASFGPGLNADEVVIDRTLLTSFDTVATLPDGEPVRLRCRQWLEAVTLRDSARGIEVEQRTPRLDIVPIALETY